MEVRQYMNRTYMKTGLVAVLVIALIISPVYAQSGNLTTAGDIDITIAGSTTVLPIAEACANVYTTINPGSQIDVSGGGSSYGIEAVADGTVDIGTASRDLKPDEQSLGLETYGIAYDGVAIVVNPANSVDELTMEELQGIYTGTITNWQQVGGTNSLIVVVSREDGSGTRDCFEQAVLEPIGGVLVNTADIQNSNGEMRTKVAGNENAIGYLSLGYVDSSISAVSLDGVEPTIKNIKSGNYAISRTLYMITNGTPDDDEQAFLDFVLTGCGKYIVVNEGFISIVSRGDIDRDGDVDMDDAIWLAKHFYGFPGYETIPTC